MSEQNVALRDKARMVCTLTEANKALEQDLRRTQELYKQQQAEWHRAMEISKQIFTALQRLLGSFSLRCA